MRFRLKNRAGIGLPIAMGATVIIGMVIAAASFASLQSYRTQRNALFQERALTAAEEGQSRTVQNWTPAWNTMADGATAEQRVEFPADGRGSAPSRATVELTRLNQYTYWAASEGSVNPTSRLLNARRRTNQLLRLQVPNLRIAAAFSAREYTGVSGSGVVSGNDYNPPGWDCDAPGPSGPGVMGDSLVDVTTSGSCPLGACIQTTTDKLGADTVLRDTTQYGSAMGYDILKQQALSGGGPVLDAPLPVRSRDVLNITTVGPTYNMDGTCNKTDFYNWGDPFRASPTANKCEDYFPTIYIRGDVTSNTVISGGYGQGILIVDGNLKINGTFMWYGPIIVRGDFTTNGATTGFGVKIVGGVLAANMNCEKSGSALNLCNSISGNTSLQFSRCAIANAVSRNALTLRSTRSWADLF